MASNPFLGVIETLIPSFFLLLSSLVVLSTLLAETAEALPCHPQVVEEHGDLPGPAQEDATRIVRKRFFLESDG